MTRTSERIRRSPRDHASEVETWPWDLHDVLEAVVTYATGPDKGRCANCHNLTGGSDLRVASNGLVSCGRCARYAVTVEAQAGS